MNKKYSYTGNAITLAKTNMLGKIAKQQKKNNVPIYLIYIKHYIYVIMYMYYIYEYRIQRKL